MTENEAQVLIAHVRDEYEPRILALMNDLRDRLEKAGWEASAVYDMTDNQFEWWLSAMRPGAATDDLDNCVDFRFEITEAAQYDGEPADGINFGLTAVEWGGRGLAGLQPYNFTPQVWVHAGDHEAVEERFSIVEHADLGELVYLSEGTPK